MPKRGDLALVDDEFGRVRNDLDAALIGYVEPACDASTRAERDDQRRAARDAKRCGGTSINGVRPGNCARRRGENDVAGKRLWRYGRSREERRGIVAIRAHGAGSCLRSGRKKRGTEGREGSSRVGAKTPFWRRKFARREESSEVCRVNHWRGR